MYAIVAQLDRAFGSDPEGQRFESSRRTVNRSLLLDIPTGWEPRAKQSRTVALLAALCRALRVAFADFSAAP